MTSPDVTAARRVPVALTIAGSEATGGAGAQTDLKTFQALGTFGMAALTCIVSFDPKAGWGHRFVPVEAQVIADQLEAQLATYDVDAVKVGMLGTPVTIETVAQVLRELRPERLVLDPVLICKGQEPGAALDTDTALKEQVLPLVTFVTPNHFEALSLSGLDAIESEDDLARAARIIHERSGAAVLAKGGVCLAGPDAVDVFYDGSTLEVLREPKVGDLAVSGAGCTLAAAVTAELAKGATALEAARSAKSFVRQAIVDRMPSRAPFEAVRQR
ncbi:hydroxymethylpyrimidine/phosphomethylpyrimidine kinase [Arsenicicoccus dermatophilus]|uniref:hydroxymethylpyrimidine/phosphomethylpyrimidine kinase n=1 Tax=Arsenicicoccus dermatophilus TaxID=1076331 RepID=UPI001F4D263E|nr:hydroxymethylpyrimidine/phosphomethylpyrimidine kinase [Arsenicicoccus dermatophilus]MCH8614008.1 hydroxymethylpyrimidine/phosphomethylpyrimidine kinase [Arsenicicoccus dermatophilus]